MFNSDVMKYVDKGMFLKQRSGGIFFLTESEVSTYKHMQIWPMNRNWKRRIPHNYQ